MTRDLHQEITDRFIEAIESGTAPWSADWIATGLPLRVTGDAYQGINTLLLAASADHAIGGALPGAQPPVDPQSQFECWYFHGTGDPCFGGDADDRVLYTNGTASAFHRSSSEAKQAGMHRALFPTERAAIEAGW